MTAAATTAVLASVWSRPGPGLDTAAPTTAALATGDGPGVTAAVTTAALARRDADARHDQTPFGDEGRFVGLDRGDDGLDRDPALGDELAAGATHCRAEGCAAHRFSYTSTAPRLPGVLAAAERLRTSSSASVSASSVSSRSNPPMLSRSPSSWA